MPRKSLILKGEKHAKVKSQKPSGYQWTYEAQPYYDDTNPWTQVLHYYMISGMGFYYLSIFAWGTIIICLMLFGPAGSPGYQKWFMEVATQVLNCLFCIRSFGLFPERIYNIKLLIMKDNILFDQYTWAEPYDFLWPWVFALLEISDTCIQAIIASVLWTTTPATRNVQMHMACMGLGIGLAVSAAILVKVQKSRKKRRS